MSNELFICYAESLLTFVAASHHHDSADVGHRGRRDGIPVPSPAASGSTPNVPEGDKVDENVPKDTPPAARKRLTPPPLLKPASALLPPASFIAEQAPPLPVRSYEYYPVQHSSHIRESTSVDTPTPP